MGTHDTGHGEEEAAPAGEGVEHPGGNKGAPPRVLLHHIGSQHRTVRLHILSQLHYVRAVAVCPVTPSKTRWWEDWVEALDQETLGSTPGRRQNPPEEDILSRILITANSVL